MLIRIGISTLVFLLHYIFLYDSKKQIEYQVITAGIHLIAFIFIKEFTVELIVYCFFAILPFLKSIRITPSAVVFTLYFVLQIIRGLRYGFRPVMATFFVMYFAVLFFCILDIKNDVCIDDIQIIKSIDMATAIEVVVCILAYIYNGTATSSFLVVNHQPVGGNLCLICSLFLLILTKKRVALPCRFRWYMVLYMMVTLLTGIRGYQIVVFPLCILIIIYTFINKYGKRRLFIVGMVAMILTSLVVAVTLMQEKLLTDISVDTDIGFRVYENKYVIRAMLESDVFHLAFGYGVFAKGSAIGSSDLIWAITNGGLWTANHLANDGRYLNVWLDYLKDSGLLGLALIICRYVWPFKKGIVGHKRSLAFFMFLYTLMLAFRNSCTCGVLELIVVTVLYYNYAGENSNHEVSDQLR